VELLLLHGANVLTKYYEGWTALDWAGVGGNNDVLKLLLEYGTDLNAEGNGRNKALLLAAEEGHEQTVQILLDNGANVNAQDSLGSTALEFTAGWGKNTRYHVQSYAI
jgi:ankyrin repeat protein